MKKIIQLLGRITIVTCLVAMASYFLYPLIAGWAAPLDLTENERDWLNGHRDNIRIAPLPDSPPVDFRDENGVQRGFTSDYIKLIEEKLDIRFQTVQCNSGKEILEKLAAQEVDVAGSVQDIEERRTYLLFTEPYESIPMIILARTDSEKKLSLDSLHGMRIAVVDGSAIHKLILIDHPDYDLIPVNDASEGLRQVSQLQVDAMVTDQGVASHCVAQLKITNLQIAGQIDLPWELRLASRKDWPELNSILNKALNSISWEEKQAIEHKWITIKGSGNRTLVLYLKIILGGLVITLLIIGIAIVRNRTLRRQISRHSEELGQARESHALAAKALDESEQRFKILIESSNDMIWEKDEFGVFKYVSPRAEDILGYAPDELIGKSSLSLMTKQDSARNMEQLRSSSAGASIDCDISTYLHKDGHEIMLESNGLAFANSKGELAGFRGVSRDITKRIENESALRRSEERFRNLVETTSDWIWEVDIEGLYTYASPQASELLGRPAQELLGRHFTAYMPESEAQRAKSLFMDMMEQGAPIQSMVNSNRHKDGRTVMLETSAVPFYDKDWNIQGYRGIGRDITDRVATEKQLEFERGLFRTFMEHAPDLIYFKDTDGRFIEVNAAKAREVNLSPEDLIGRTDFDFLPHDQALIRSEDEQHIMQTREPIQKEEVAATPEGDRWYLTTKAPRYDEQGNVVGTFGTSWNITVRKLAEEQLRQLRSMLSNTINSMPSILIGVDAAGRVIQWNRQAETTTGRLAKDAIDLPLGDVFPEMSKEMIKVERAIRERTPQKEERIQVNDGDRTRYHDVTVYPLLDHGAEGAVIRVDDVTDRVMIEDSIRNIVEGVASVGRRFFNSMVEQLAKTLDADYTFIAEFSDETQTIMRTIAVASTADALENFDFKLVKTPHAIVLDGNVCMYIENTRSRFPDTVMLQDLDINGYIGIPLVDSENHTQGIMVALYKQPVEQVEFATSIMQVFAGRTAAELERLQATKDLMALRNQLENIINSMPSMLVSVDEDGSVVQWNREAENITGITSAAAQGKPLDQVFPDFGSNMSRLLKTVDVHNMQRHERIHCTISGEPHMLDVTIYPITTDGIEGAVIRLDDVTDRARIEEMMVQSEKMMSVGGLAAGMAHEINNPLAGILQNLQVMRNRITHPTEVNTGAAAEVGTSLEAIQAYMEKRGLLNMMDSISEAGRRAARIVDNMLSFSRKDEANFAPNNIEEIIERSIELASNDYNLKKRFDFRHITIVRKFEDLPEIPCEGSQIQQVILNLLTNSAQAMSERQEENEHPQITIRLKKDMDMILIQVEDNGPGMNAETRKRAFEPFFTTKDVGHGTGLGLSVSYFIITENHGGTMNLASAPGRGASFSIRIPMEHRMVRWGLRL